MKNIRYKYITLDGVEIGKELSYIIVSIIGLACILAMIAAFAIKLNEKFPI